MLKLTFCPKLKLFSMTTLVVLVCLIMFIVTLSIGGVATGGDCGFSKYYHVSNCGLLET